MNAESELAKREHYISVLEGKIKAAESRLAAAQKELAKLHEWFEANASVLASHRIGGFLFCEEKPK